MEAAAKFCLACGHDLETQGPITSTGHDLNQLKDVIRMRDDLSMAEKFDMIAKVEDGANPIHLGIAAPADDGEVGIDGAFAGAEALDGGPSSVPVRVWGESKAARAATKAVLEESGSAAHLKAGKIDLDSDSFKAAKDAGNIASHLIHVVSAGESEGIDPEAMRSVPVLEPPKRSFCPKCGSDIHSNTLLQWKKWQGLADTVVSMRMEASMDAAMAEVSASYLAEIQSLKDQLEDVSSKAEKAVEKAQSSVDESKIRAELEKEIRAQLEKEYSGKNVAAASSSPNKASTGGRSAVSTSPVKKSKPKKSGGGMFGAKKVKKTYEGEPEGKAEWFLEEALDTVYDPHGTGKTLKPGTILARSADGNVRVRDVIRI